MEDLEKENSKAHLLRIRKNNLYVYNMVFIEELNTILTCQTSGTFVQYDLNDSCITGKIIKNYGNAGISSLSYAISIGHLGILGGYSGVFRFVNLKTRKFLDEKIISCLASIRFMRICPVVNDDPKKMKVLLALNCHYSTSFNKGKSDFFDITEVVRMVGISDDIIRNYREH